MILWDIEGHEVVPSVLDLLALCNTEAQSAHDVFEMLDGLRDWVELT